MKEQKGINAIAVVIGVLIGLLIVGIGGVLILSNKEETEQPPVEEILPVIEDAEVTEKEKQEIKKEYLGYFASVAIAADEAMLDEASIMTGVAVTRMWKSMENEYNENAFNTGALENLANSNTVGTINNTIGNIVGNEIVNTTTTTLSTNNNVVTNNFSTDLNMNTLTNNINSSSAEISTLPKFPDGTTVLSREADIQNAIFETFGQKLDNLSQILEASWSIASDEDYNTTVLQLADITKSSGIYTATYIVCAPTENDISSGVNLYGLDSYTIEAKFQKNENPTYSQYQLLSIDVMETKTPIAYHLTYADGKYGVIDNNGVVILDTKYSKVIIPNSYIGLFVCYSEGIEAPIMLNERGIQQFKEYTTATLIEATAGAESTWTEQGVVLVQKDGYYGLVDYYGNIIYDVEYQAIAPLGYQREKLVLTKEGKQALANTDGEIITDFLYDKIGILGIDFEASVLVNATRTQEDVISMMEKDDYTIGLTASGAYSIIETNDANEVSVVMLTIAKEYQMQIGIWQLALLDGVLPVYTKTVQQ